MSKQEIVSIDRNKDIIIIQDKTVSYHEIFENFKIDYGSEIPEYIQTLNVCKDTGLKTLNGSVIKSNTLNGNDAIVYADTLIQKAQILQKAKESRENSIVNLTDEEKSIIEKQKEISQKEAELEEINNQLFDLMCEDFANRLQEIQTLPEVKEEIISLFNQKSILTKEIEDLKQQIENLS